MLHLRVVYRLLVGSNLFIEFVSKYVLVAQQVFHLAFVDRHFRRVCKVHRASLVTIAIFESVVFDFTHLRQPLQLLLAGNLVEQAIL